MKAVWAQVQVSLRLQLRNRLALIYGYVFPAVFLLAFWVLYRHEPVPLLRHVGELLTVTVLGGACFGLPTTLVAERERGVWRRYRLLPGGTGRVLTGTLLARLVILVSAGVMQLLLALAVGMSWPAQVTQLAGAFLVVSFAFIGIGLMLAMLADNVPAVQALGQCVFLPMLIIGGVAVPVASLPEWAQRVSLFLPGRYAVDALQGAVDGSPWRETSFAWLALGVMGIAGCIVAVKLFRWESGQRLPAKKWLWVLPGIVACGVIGVTARPGGQKLPKVPVAHVAAPEVMVTRSSWKAITPEDVAAMEVPLPPDEGVVTPFAGPDEAPPSDLGDAFAEFRGAVAVWPPARERDPVQRARNLLAAAATADLLQHPLERFIPREVLALLEAPAARGEQVQQLAWIALTPEQGTVPTDFRALGFASELPEGMVRERVQIYALKCLARLRLGSAGAESNRR